MKLQVNIKEEGWGKDFEYFDIDLVSENVAEVKSYPLLSYINYGDVVSIEKKENVYLFKNINKKSGWKIFRIVFLDKEIKPEVMYDSIKVLHDMGCHLEKPYYLVATLSFPPSSDFIKIEEEILKISKKINIEYERI